MERLPKGRKAEAPYWMDAMDVPSYISMIQGIGYSNATIDELYLSDAGTLPIPTKVNLSVGYPLRDVLITAYK